MYPAAIRQHFAPLSLTLWARELCELLVRAKADMEAKDEVPCAEIGTCYAS